MKSPAPILALSFAIALHATQSACVKHIASYKPKQRVYELLTPKDTEAVKTTSGSLWSAQQAANYFFSDQRALLANDVVTVRISEESSALSDATTKLDSSSEVKMGVDALFGLVDALKKANAGTTVVGANARNAYEGSGATTRRGDVKATVPAVVRKVLHNGNLFIEGHRVILVNDEEYHFYISGVVRPIDIDGGNSVESSKIADAEIEFTGRGTITEKQQPGWLSRALDWAWPF